ncbi:hypothetical protein M3667_13970 [Microbacterium sp. P26]|uniref:Ig-like domain-containing protein n=1 Tax=Microbacterium TaxID=33882 RepID=UPI0020406EEB|nr:Ig-like domain-containing protein [Microbacterium sp. P26]MCM3502976.1 hypothetical protein [Microbacterium sp. P26]
MTRNMKRLGWAGASAALALTASGLLAPAVAFAGEAESTAPTSGPQFDSTAKKLMTENHQVEGVAKDGSGNVVIFTSTDEAGLEGTAKAFVDSTSNVVVKNIGKISALAATDVVGGAGYISPIDATSGALCSVGFSGWTPEGDPAVITAGHCNADGTLTQSFLTVPSRDQAAGGTQPAIAAPLGTLGFSQFGGPGNSEGANGNASSVDIATIDVTNVTLDLLPEITDWTTTSDLSKSTTDVRAVGKAQLNTSASKSGRTTGLTSGTVTAEGWMQVQEEDEVRWVYGFAVEGAPGTVAGGDSGGAVFQGDTAVGVVSGGDPATGSFMWAADLQAGLERTGGYSVALKIDAPVLTTPADGGSVAVGGTISGTAPAGSTVKVTPAAGDAFEATTDGSGNWSFPAPDKLGDYDFSLQAVNGYNTSAKVDASVVVKAEAPVIVSPVDGSIVENELTAISGTGLAGATVTLSGDATGTAKVSASGQWSVKTDLGIGTYSVTAVQARDGQTSAEATSSFTVAPSAPTISGIQDGATYSGAAVPTSVSGTGVAGAKVVVTINDAKVGETTVDEDGTWSIVLPAALGEGPYAVVATQTVEGVSSSATVSFAVAAVPAPSPSSSGTPAPGGNGGAGNGGAGNGGNGGSLAVTGMGDVAPFAWGAAALLLAGFGALGYRKVRRSTR